jgi:hypothetical protein
MFPINVKASEQIAVLDTIAMPTAGTTASTVTTGWISATNFNKFLAIISTGVLGASATVDAKLQQATDSSGTGVKDITNKAITQIVKASGDNKEATIDLDAQELDVTNGFAWIRLSVTVGTATSAVAANLLGFISRNYPASTFNNANVVQQV